MDWSKPEFSQLVQMQPRKRVYCSMVLYPEVVQDQKKMNLGRSEGDREKCPKELQERNVCSTEQKVSFGMFLLHGGMFLHLTDNVKHAFAAQQQF